MKKYIVIGDWVRSQSDGQVHYISAEELVRLYRVRRSECILLNRMALSEVRQFVLRILRPQEDGHYSLNNPNVK